MNQAEDIGRNKGSCHAAVPDPALRISERDDQAEKDGIMSESPGHPVQARYRKVGRLKPGETGIIHIFSDQFGEIGVISRTDAVLTLEGMRAVPVNPSGSISLSASGQGLLLTIPGHEGIRYLVIARQVRTLIRDWPKKKAALFVVDTISPPGMESAELTF